MEGILHSETILTIIFHRSRQCIITVFTYCHYNAVRPLFIVTVVPIVGNAVHTAIVLGQCVMILADVVITDCRKCCRQIFRIFVDGNGCGIGICSSRHRRRHLLSVVIAARQGKAEALWSLLRPVILPEIFGYAYGSRYRGQPVRDGRPAYRLRVTAWNVHFIYRVSIVVPLSILPRKVLELISRRFSRGIACLKFNLCIMVEQHIIIYWNTVLIQLNVNVLALSVIVVVILPLFRYRNRSRVQRILKGCCMVSIYTLDNRRSFLLTVVVIGNFTLQRTVLQRYTILIYSCINRKVMPGRIARIDRSILSVYGQRLISRIGRIARCHICRVGCCVVLVCNVCCCILDRVPVSSVRAVLQRDSDRSRAFPVEVVKVIPRLIQRQIKYGDVMLIRDCCCIGFFSFHGIRVKLYRCRRICRL